MKKRLFSYCTIGCMIILLLVSCSNKIDSEETPEITKELKDNINELFSESNLRLKIKQSNAKYHSATSEFTLRILNKLKENRVYTPYVDINDINYDIVLKFDGYKEIFLNTDEEIFWFDDANEIYEMNNWSTKFWNRYILKEVNGEILYHSFEKDVIERTYIDVDNDEELDDVSLYYDGDIRLKVKDTEVIFMPDVEEEMISSLIASNTLESHLYIRSNEKDNSIRFLVGSTYSHTNKYGTTSWLTYYEYKDGIINKEWDSEDILSGEIIVHDYKDDILKVYITSYDLLIDVKLTQEEIEELTQYINYLDENNKSFIGKEDYLFFAVMPQYKFYDYDNDGEDELITRSYIRGGAAGITDNLISVYTFTGEGVVLKDVFLGRDNNELADIFY